MTRTDRINIIGWIGVTIAVLTHFGAILWFGRGVVDDVEYNKVHTLENRRSISELNKQINLISRELHHIQLLERDVREVKSDIKEIKELLKR